MHVPFVLSLLVLILTMLEFGTMVNPIRAKMPTMGGMSSKFWQLWSKPSVRALFHWKNSNGLIFFLWGAVIAMAALGATLDNADYLFKYAYAFAVAAYLSSFCSWMTSKTVHRERHLSRQQIRHQGKKWRIKTWIGCLLVTLFFLVTLDFVSEVRLNKELQQLANRLFPGSDPTPANGCDNVPPDATLFLYGENGNAVMVKQFPHVVVQAISAHDVSECRSGCPVLSVDKNPSDQSIVVLMDVRDKDNKVIVQLDSEGFHVNPNNYYKMRRTNRSSLVVRDQEDNRVLDVHYLNPKAISVDGILHVHGKEVNLYMRGLANNCSYNLQSSDVAIGIP